MVRQKNYAFAKWAYPVSFGRSSPLLSGTRQIADLANLFDLGQLDRFWQAGSIKGSIGVVE
jgi:hypothetical protein